MSANPSKDHWSASAYQSAASFVPALTTKVVAYLDPQPNDHILDIGCGDGPLTGNIAARCSSVTGLDSSASMIDAANNAVAPQHPNANFYVLDCRHLDPAAVRSIGLVPGQFDKVFSNAAIHWILGGEAGNAVRETFFRDVAVLLRPGGRFTFEMGGAGNVAEAHAAMRAVLMMDYKKSSSEIAMANPWFFPSEHLLRDALTKAGFDVQVAELEYRPTKLNPKGKEHSGGIEGWVRLMGADFAEMLDEAEKERFVARVCEVLEGVTARDDGSEYLTYVRARAVATKRA